MPSPETTSSMMTEEQARSAALHRFDILDTPREADFDDIAALAAEVCQTPIAVVNLVDTDRQFFKAEVGLGVRETPLDTSFCGQAILSEDIMIVPDAMLDPRFSCNPLVTQAGGLRFYAGALLRTREGHAIGTVCVLDTQPRTLDDHQVRTLRLLARQAMTQLDLRVALRKAQDAEARRQQVLDSAVDHAIISLDLDGRVTGWNLGACNVLGWSAEDMLARPIDTIFTPEDCEAGIPAREMEAARIDGRGADERWHLRRDGTRFFALGEMMPLRDGQGQHVGYVKILRDRTRARRQTQRLALLGQASARLLSSDDPARALHPILSGGAEAIGFDQFCLFDLAPDGQTLILQQSGGLPPDHRDLLEEATLDVPLCGIVAETGRPLILTDLDGPVTQRFRIAQDFGMKAYAGMPICVRGRLVGVISFASNRATSFDDEALSFFGTIARFLSIAHERAEDARQIRDAEQRSRLAQEAGRIGTFQVDVHTDTVLASPQFCRIFGLPEATALKAADLEALVLNEDGAQPSNRAGRQEGRDSGDVEYRILRADDGTQCWIQRRAEYLRDDEGRVRWMVGTVQDITHRKLAALRQEALLTLGVRLRQATARQAMIDIACETLHEVLEVTRAGYASVDRRAGIYVVSGLSGDGAEGLHASYSLGDFAASTSHLVAGDTLVLRDIEHEPALARDRDSYRAAAVAAQISVPQIERGDLVGALFVHQTRPRDWTSEEVDFVRRLADRFYAALATAAAEERQNVLNHELSHRLKNSLSMVQAIASQTLRSATSRTALEDFLHRIRALSAAHDVLLDHKWEAGAIHDIIRSTAATLAQADRIRAEGPDLSLGPRSALTLSMLLHELATNAVKYGALSTEAGVVEIRWTLEEIGPGDRDFVLRWHEEGGPPVAPPLRHGFGSRLIRLGLTGAGGVEQQFDAEGLRVSMRAPLFSLVQD
ncbi:GAF domain-containing protein [Falsirhodobacter algicola]|uniref:histidine kinase n=1 Tax=Falsirhodobacter algicola TaxID=2692330 RepID=A0A8J8MV67_9RHOB|nr:GAF domain-containing protein [Falsirhodobacter algicola]QUS37307.1 GAF domain-containing protein [Falsirhodobacter algicola]